MNPFYESAGDIQALSAMDRARIAMTQQEHVEQREAEQRAYNAQAKAEADMMMTRSRHRQERFYLGATTEELAAQEAAQREWKEARIHELETELERLDPVRFRVKRARALRDSVPDIPAAVLARQQEGRELVTRIEAEREHREMLGRSTERQQEIRRLEALCERDRLTRTVDDAFMGVY